MKLYKTTLILLFVLILTACSSENKIIRISEPNFTDETTENKTIIEGANVINTLKNKDEIEKLSRIMEEASPIEQPPDFISDQKPDNIIEIYNKKQSTSEHKRTIWLNSNGIILQNSSEEYFQLTEEQSELLHSILDSR